MNTKQALLTAIILLGLGFLVWRVFPKKPDQPPAAQTQTWETKTDEQWPVLVKVTPLEPGARAGQWKFNVVFDTHSAELDFDILQAVSLVDDQGRANSPLAWDGPGPGGHHREGILTFAAINPTPPFVELKIKNIAGIPERALRWNFEKK